MSGNVVSMIPYVATVPVCVELLLITMEVTLCFGPFNSYEEGKDWVARFELARAEIEKQEDITVEGVFNEVGAATQPFVDAHTYVCDVVSGGPDARKTDAIIPFGDPVRTAKVIAIYALRTLQEAVEVGLAHVEDEEVH